MTFDPLVQQLVAGAAAHAAGAPPPGEVPNKIKHEKRFPFLFLVDISGSTGDGGANADIHAINRALGEIFATLKNPPPSTPLADQNDLIDVSVVSYSDEPRVEVDWSLADELPASTNFTPQRGTRTARAMDFSLAHIAKRLQYFADPNNRIPSGLPHIIHITDGAPTDMTPGDQRWEQIAAKLGRLGYGENQKAEILHFVSPNGCRLNPLNSHLTDGNGNLLTGQQALAKLSGAKSVYEIGQGSDTIADLVKLITLLMTTISSFANVTKAHDIAAEAAKNSKNINGTTYE